MHVKTASRIVSYGVDSHLQLTDNICNEGVRHSALGVLNDYALYISTHSLSHRERVGSRLQIHRPSTICAVKPKTVCSRYDTIRITGIFLLVTPHRFFGNLRVWPHAPKRVEKWVKFHIHMLLTCRIYLNRDCDCDRFACQLVARSFWARCRFNLLYNVEGVGRAFQFGQKKFRFDSILATESIFSIRFDSAVW